MLILLNVDDSYLQQPTISDLKRWLEAGQYIVNSIEELQDANIRPTDPISPTAQAALRQLSGKA